MDDVIGLACAKAVIMGFLKLDTKACSMFFFSNSMPGSWNMICVQSYEGKRNDNRKASLL